MGEKLVRQGGLDITVFVCGGVVMTYEIIGSRILSPFIGASTYVWTSLIGVILAALSLGYWLGGRMADRKPAVGVLASVIFIAAGLISLTVFIKEIVLSMVASAPVGIELRAVIASIILFAPASICLGFVPPYVVKLRMLSLDDAGKTVGRLYALSTVGSIIGTFAAGFLLIPFVGSVRTLYGLSAILIVLSLALVPFNITRTKIAVIVIFVFSVVSNEAHIVLLRQANDLHDIDTEYSRVQVFKTNDPKTGRTVRAMATDPYFTQSAMFLDGDEHVFDYTRYYHLARHFQPEFREVLMVGGAGYTVPKDLLRRYPEVNIDVVEIDPQMTEIAERFFELKHDPRLSITHEDGRTFLRRSATERYDVIMIDAFGSLFSVPYQLTTIEAVREMHRSLRENGVVIFNLGSAIDGPASRFLHAELATYRAVFPHVHLFKVNAERSDETLQNLIIVASRSDSPINLVSTDTEIAGYLANLYPVAVRPDAQIITDDVAPVEYYNAIAQNVFLKSNR